MQFPAPALLQNVCPACDSRRPSRPQSTTFLNSQVLKSRKAWEIPLTPNLLHISIHKASLNSFSSTPKNLRHSLRLSTTFFDLQASTNPYKVHQPSLYIVTLSAYPHCPNWSLFLIPPVSSSETCSVHLKSQVSSRPPTLIIHILLSSRSVSDHLRPLFSRILLRPF